MNENAAKGSGCPVWVKGLLVVSLVANMAIAGLYVGLMSQSDRPKRGPNAQIDWILKFVPEARRAEAEEIFASKREPMRELYRARSKNLEEIVNAIRAEPYAPETLVSAIRARRENSAERRMIVEDTLVELLTTFNQEERVHFANEMEERLKKWQARRAGK